MISDLKSAFRSLVKSPGFSAVPILILALGIGAVTAVFSAVDAILLRSLPFERPQELYCLNSAVVNEVGLFSLPEYCAYRDESRAFTGLAGATTFNTNMVDEGEARFVQGMKVSGNVFTLLGAHASAGRLLVPDDDKPDSAKVVVIGRGLWQRAFGGKPEAIGRTVTVDGVPRTIVGVLPAGFVLPLTTGVDSDICVPLQADSDPLRYKHASVHALRVFGRIAPGVTETQARSDLSAVLQNLKKNFPPQYEGGSTNRLTPLGEEIVKKSRPLLLTLFGIVAALLLLASANLAGLHLVRAIGRQHEFALRTALGASRPRLMRLVLAECLVLAVAGGLAGLVVANWTLSSLTAFIPADFLHGQELKLDGTILAFAAFISIGFGLAPGLAPVWLVSGIDLRSAMAAAGRKTAGGQSKVRRTLAAVQVALALALLMCTGLFLRSFWAARTQRLGFDTTNALTARLSLPSASYRDVDAIVRHYDRLQARLSSVPGVEKVGVTSLLPLATGLATINFTVAGQSRPKASEVPEANYRVISPSYFTSMGIAVRVGRVFTERDDIERPLALVVGSTLADALFPKRSALGQRLVVEDTSGEPRTGEIVGVVDNVKQTKIEDAPSFDIYVAYRQMDIAAVPWLRYRTFWVLRGSAPAATMEQALRREVHAEDASIAISSVRTLEQVSNQALATRRFTLSIVGFFAGTALLLTVAGIYSVVAFGVAQRTREFGVRLALGATAERIFGLVLREGLAIVLLGAVGGILVSLIISELLAAQLYGVSPRDPVALAAAVLLIAVVAFVACWLPARRATRVDPVVALRAD